jgi:membrane-associated protease RseP (regulator of RpoE activity)
MQTVMIYDLIFLVVFCLAVFLFLYSRRKNLQRDGIMYLYRTKWGMMEIERFSKKYSKLLHALKYPIVIIGFALMAIMIFMLCKTVYVYVFFPQISDVIKAPPVMPLIPYFPQIFGVQNILPDFYGAYFLIALLVIAVVHEFAHGVYMRLFKTKIKSTGFGFLGPVLAAFVEQDDKDFRKKKNFEQMVTLGAGVFANILFALIFFIILLVFFTLSYTPAAYIANYASANVSTEKIDFIYQDGNFTKIISSNQSYLYPYNISEFALMLNKTNASSVALYLDAPAIRAGLRGNIVSINGERIMSQKELLSVLNKKKPGDNITLVTLFNESQKEYLLSLSKNPLNNTVAFLGIGMSSQPKGINKLLFLSDGMSFKKYSYLYNANYNPSIAKYFFYLLWWIALINLFVGLFNMLPLSILDGGRFLYLAILSITKKEEVAKRGFKYATRLIGLIFLAMIIAWVYSLIVSKIMHP